MKKFVLILLATILLLINIANSQNITIQNSTAQSQNYLFTIPFFGNITIPSLFVACVSFFIGYSVGSGLKSGTKFAVILLLFVVILYVFGFIGKEIIAKLGEIITPLSELLKTIEQSMQSIFGSVNLQLFALFVGFMIGFWRG
jgi:hypothetical protein